MATKVIESWKIITKIPNYEEIAGEMLFRKVFTLAPAVHGLFRFAKEYEPNSEELFASQRFKEHAKGVISTVNVAISMLSPDIDPLLEILVELGKVHAQYGALPAHYAIVGRALIETLQDVLQDKFTNDVKTSWARVYDLISTAMIEGADADY